MKDVMLVPTCPTSEWVNTFAADASISVEHADLIIKQVIASSPLIEMPDFTPLIKAVKKAVEVLDEIVADAEGKHSDAAKAADGA